MSKKLIISIDGGGIRGVIPLVILREIQSNLKRDLFDLTDKWTGTSTGAVICASLLVQKGTEPFIRSVQDVLDIYEFRSQKAINPLVTKSPTRALYKIFDQNFGQFEMTDFPELNVVTCRRAPIEAVVFNANNSCNMADAIKASCAVPGIFDKVKIGDEYYVDGFLRAKNPAILSLEGVTLDENLVVLSLGSGILREEDMIERQVKETHNQMLRLSEEKKFTYLRFDPVLNLAVDSMQNTSLKNIFNLKKDTENHLIENQIKIIELAELLD